MARKRCPTHNVLNLVLLLGVLCLSAVESCNPEEGWVAHGGSCYKLLYPILGNWRDGQAFCQEYGAHLANLETQEEFVFVSGLIKDAAEADSSLPLWRQWWVGGKNEGNSGYIWEGTGVPVSDSMWGYRQPHVDDADVAYTSMEWSDLGGWGLRDVPGGPQYLENIYCYSICEKP